MADLKITDKYGNVHIHSPTSIFGYLYVDGKYITILHTMENSEVDLTGGGHSLMFSHN